MAESAGTASSSGIRMTAYIAIRIGNCRSIGRHPPSGLTPASLYSFIVSSWIFSRFPLYFVWMALILGWIACIWPIDLICFTPSGRRMNRRSSVSRTMEIP